MLKKLLYLLLLMFPVLVFGQEYLTGIGGNPVIKSYLKEHPEALNMKSDTLDYIRLTLPFFDDFSEISVYPDTSRWVNNEAFINSNFPYFPPDFGVATMDAIDADGNVYSEANPITFLADRLISRPIRLDSGYIANENIFRRYNPTDSVYFSFYYQPQGRGDIPLKHDSLVLQFGSFNGNAVFSHYSYTEVFGYEYDTIALVGYAPPGTVIYPPGDSCNSSLGYTLADTFFVTESLFIPCDSVFEIETDWTTVWSAEGDTLELFINEHNSFFKYEVIPIVDTAWFRNDFQFRFVNYASISTIGSWQSNTDHWHIDRVKLDVNRTKKDMFQPDIRFVQDAKTFLKGYTSMPHNQYASNPTSFTRDSTAVYCHNLDSLPHDVVSNYYVQRENGDTLIGFAIDDYTKTLNPYEDININNYQPFVKRPIEYVFVTGSQNKNYNFKISHVARDADSPEVGDTLIFNQLFSNYLSVDDGSVERGYGISPAGSKFAVKFNTSLVDTLWGVQMFFNKTFNGANDKSFNIFVWQDNNGEPGNVLYEEENVKPGFTNGLNRFYTQWFSDPVKLGVETFYVGIEQSSSQHLNIGFDKNINSKHRNFFTSGGSWVNSSLEGSIMIRPVLDKTPYVGISESTVSELSIHIFPNPVNGGNDINIRLDEDYKQNAGTQNLSMEIIDIYGEIVYQGPFIERLSTVNFVNGFYILRIIDKAKAKYFTAKLLIN